MLNLSEFATSTEERVLTGVKASQTVVIDGIKSSIAFADRVVPATLSDRIEDRMTNLPSATPVLNGAFGFATKMLEAQRDFVAEVIEILQPAPVKAAPAKKAPVAKKAAAKKAPARKPAAKRTKKVA